jgi:predicted nucleic acid-binding protein
VALLRGRLDLWTRVSPALDLQIASIAMEHDAPLATHNQRHFKRVPGLVVEDWLA